MSMDGAVVEEKTWLIVELDEEELIEESSDDESDEELDSDALSNEKTSDEKSIIEDLYKRFSVSATPEEWVHVRNMRIYCYWPKTDPGKKIRSGEVPKKPGDKNWTVHSCRILMNGEKFKSYKEAKEAERIAENCSTMSEFNAFYGRKRQHDNNAITSKNKIMRKAADLNSTIESTMDFLVESISEDSDSDDDILDGNDSSGYNEIVKCGGDYLKTDSTRPNGGFQHAERYTSSSDEDSIPVKLRNNNKADTIHRHYIMNTLNNENEVPSNTIYSPKVVVKCVSEATGDESCYSQFKLTLDECYSSTRLEERSPQSKAEIEKPNTFVNTEKEIGECTLEFESNANPEPYANCTKGNILSQIAKVGRIVTQFNSTMHEELHYLNECAKLLATNTSSVPILKKHHSEVICSKSGENVASVSSSIDIQNVEVASEENAAPASSKIDILNVELLNVPIHPEILIEVPNTVTENTTSDSVIELPINGPEHYKKIEDLVEEKSFESKSLEEESHDDALVKYLLPFNEETETKYMDRIVDVLFDEDFFVDSITWKKEKDEKRVLITGSNILKCWMKSYETNFRPDDKFYSKFKGHFRRIKSKKRAAKKTQAEKAAKLCEKKIPFK